MKNLAVWFGKRTFNEWIKIIGAICAFILTLSLSYSVIFRGAGGSVETLVGKFSISPSPAEKVSFVPGDCSLGRACPAVIDEHGKIIGIAPTLTIWRSKCLDDTTVIAGTCALTIKKNSNPVLVSFGINKKDNAWDCLWQGEAENVTVQAVCVPKSRLSS